MFTCCFCGLPSEREWHEDCLEQNRPFMRSAYVMDYDESCEEDEYNGEPDDLN